MGLHGKLVASIEFNAGGDVFHELLRYKPHQISTICPEIVKGCDLHEGEFSHVGSIICWNYIHYGKAKKIKEVIQLIDEEKRLIQFKVIEGDLMELYKDFVITIHIEKNSGIDLVTTTFEYEMLNENVEHPISNLSLVIDIIKAIETRHLAQP
ncbi:kirola-like [Salvia divinorum]|uniref:Kirola-like n=1 Tax=Salvia divinorum TaxID=28513 RepID=A0ABD1GB49_SALDI